MIGQNHWTATPEEEGKERGVTFSAVTNSGAVCNIQIGDQEPENPATTTSTHVEVVRHGIVALTLIR